LTEIVLFGGTTEGRAIGELLCKKGVSTLLCVATDYGRALLNPTQTLRVHTGRLDKPAMEALFQRERPRLVIDATHPYANIVSGNISAACEKSGVLCLRVLRENSAGKGCATFFDIGEMVGWINDRPGVVFSALGAKEAVALTAVVGYRERVWLRILPDSAGLLSCLAAGFPARHIICMQGPFSKELNAAMFRETRANILLTKESGKAGGYSEKLLAARACNVATAVLTRPRRETGLTLTELMKRLEEGAL
jgi:precorrin-6x reductase